MTIKGFNWLKLKLPWQNKINWNYDKSLNYDKKNIMTKSQNYEILRNYEIESQNYDTNIWKYEFKITKHDIHLKWWKTVYDSPSVVLRADSIE